MLGLLYSSCTIIMFGDLHGLLLTYIKKCETYFGVEKDMRIILIFFQISSEWHLLLDFILPGDKA